MSDNEISLSLAEGSKSYGSGQETYEAFCRADDAPGHVCRWLEKRVAGKRLFDFGCGSGKYLSLLSPACAFCAGADRSASQLRSAASKPMAPSFAGLVCQDICDLALAPSFGAALASWVLGTILDEKRRLRALERMKESLAPGGEILLVENEPGSEFELMRGRDGVADMRTEEYNGWLAGQGFEVAARIATHFRFGSMREAREVAGKIWGPQAASEVRSDCIGHGVLIFSLKRE